MRNETDKARQEAADSPVAWFVVLERARQDDDFALAARATRELRRLGVVVKHHKQKAPARA